MLMACLSVRAVPALDPSRGISGYGHDVWRVEQGLPQDTIEDLAQTADGYLWIATQRGLARFDGVRFKVFDLRNTPGLHSQAIDSLFPDPDGSLWFTTDGGGLVHLRDGRITSLTATDGLPTDRLRSLLHDPDGTLWVGTNLNGLVRLRKGAISHVDGLTRGTVTGLLRDRQGDLWIGTEEGLARLHGGRISFLTTRDGLPHDRVTALRADPRGSLWIGTARGLARLDGNRIGVPPVPELAGEEVLDLVVDRDGALWVGTRNGLGRLRDGRFEWAGADGELAGESVTALFEDREGSLWIGTGNGGLHRLKDVAFSGISRRDGLTGFPVWCTLEDRRGDVWIGTEAGLNLLHEGRLSPFPGQEELRRRVVRAIAEDRDGALWLGTYRGLYRLHDGRLTVLAEREGLPDSRVLTLLPDREGALWIGTFQGIARLQGGRLTAVRGPGFPTGRIYALHKDRRGTLWVGTKDGLGRVTGGRFEVLAPRMGAPSGPVFSFLEDADGTLWIAAGAGLFRYRHGAFTAFTERDGMLEGGFLLLIDDGRGNLWGCEKGLLRLRKADLEAHVAGRRIPARSFDAEDGMPSSECSGIGRPAGMRMRDGRLWFPTARGVAIVDPAHLPFNRLAPPLAIEEIVAGERTFVPGGPTPEIPQVRLPPGTDRFEIRYSALSLLDPGKVRFRYRLQGFDHAWVEAGARRTADFTNLSPGRYTFEVMACNNDGVWSPPTALALWVEPRFYQTSWFVVLCVVAVVATGMGTLRLRTRSILRHRRELEALVEERTRALAGEKARAEQARQEAEEASRAKSEFLANVSHEIRTPMNAVIGMTSVLLGTSLSRDQKEWVGTIRKSGEDLLVILNDILDLSKIEAGHLEIDLIPFSVTHCVEEAVELLSDAAARKRLEIGSLVGPEVPATVLSDATRLRQVLVNLIGNAVKFTREGEVFVSVNAGAADANGKNLDLRFAVLDTGPGIPPGRLDRLFKPFSQADSSTTRLFGGTGLGLTISQRLVEKLGGAIAVESTPGRGSTFSFTIRCEPVANGTDGGMRDTEGLEGRRLLIAAAAAPAARVIEGYARQWGLHVERATGATGRPEKRFHLAVVDQEEASAQDWLAVLEEAGVPAVLLRPLGVQESDAEWTPTAVTRPIRRWTLLSAFRATLGLAVSVAGGTSSRDDTGELRAGLPYPLRILLAEDNSVNQKVALLLLERLGYRADVAANGLEVLEALRRQDYDLILMDVQMPEMDGLEAARCIRAGQTSGVRPRIVAMTANALRGDREACIAAGMDDYVSKPILIDDLRAAIQGAQIPDKLRTEPVELPVLDPVYLDGLFELQRSSGREVVSLLIESYVAEAPRRLAALRAALAQGDREQLVLVAHTLKGGSAQLGAARVAAVSRELEERAREARLDGAGEVLDRLERELETVSTALLARRAAGSNAGTASAAS